MHEKKGGPAPEGNEQGLDLPAGYEAGAFLAKGGMGEILVANHVELRRNVVLKFLRPEFEENDEARLQFIAEAQICGQLVHPGVPPVHEMGRTPGGRLYYAMKRVQGETLADILRKIAADPKTMRKRYSLRDLVAALEIVAETLAFAHARGVIHRDVKPENIMISTHREVHLMDWGLAKVRTGKIAFPQPGQPARVSTALEHRASETEFGQLKGTLAYMSPEQLMGESSDIDGRSDIYALGSALYEVATLQPPFDLQDRQLVMNKLGGHIREPAKPKGWTNSDSLMRIALEAMATRPEERQRDAAILAEQLRLWSDTRVERTRRRKSSSDLGERGRKLAQRYVRWRQKLADAEKTLRTREAEVLPWQPLSDKKALFAARREVSRVRVATQLLFEQACHMLEAARVHHPGNKQAKRVLSALWRSRLMDAEATRDSADIRMSVLRLRQIHGRVRSFFRGTGELRLDVEGPPAEVKLYTLRDKSGFMTKASKKKLGETPTVIPILASGSYVAVLKRPNSLSTRYPFVIRRGGSWKGSVRMPNRKAVPHDCVFVAGGPFWFGRGAERAWLEEPDFAIQKYPVTFLDYLEFLIDLERNHGMDHALSHVPRTRGEPLVARVGQRRYRVLHTLMSEEARSQSKGLHGKNFESTLPVVGVRYADALAYCRWMTERSGFEYRIPTEYQWEKAARGVDGRSFPWGDVSDPCLAKCRDARPGAPFPEPVGTFRESRSIYGMADAAGGVWEWTRSWIDESKTVRVVRGGSWGHSVERGASWFRDPRPRDHRDMYTGFRCAVLLESDG